MTTFIIIPPKPIGAASLSKPVNIDGFLAERREANASLLRKTLADQNAIDFMRSIQGSAPQQPWRGSGGTRRGKKPPRSLDAVGAVLVDDLSTDELANLRRQGARVLENIEIRGIEPMEWPKKRSNSAFGAWHLNKVGASYYHATGITGKDTLIGIADTGIDATHPEFEGKTVYFSEFDSDGNQLATPTIDRGEHGTHVAGLAAGRNCGIAPGASLAVAAVLTTKNAEGKMVGTLAQVLAGFNWLLQTKFDNGQRVSVLNASLSSDGWNDYALDIFEEATSLRSVALVAAIGNNGPDPNKHGSPGNYQCVVGVGATDVNDQIANFSDHGVVPQQGGIQKPDICAPGVNVESALPGGTYGAMSGTSMASPIVAGACALLREEDPSTLASTKALTQALRDKVVPVGNAAGSGLGRLQL